MQSYCKKNRFNDSFTTHKPHGAKILYIYIRDTIDKCASERHITQRNRQQHPQRAIVPTMGRQAPGCLAYTVSPLGCCDNLWPGADNRMWNTHA